MKLADQLKRIATLSACFCACVVPVSVLAEADWTSLTIDNDIFFGSDSGYTNGLYYSSYNTPERNRPEIGFLAQAMRWSLSDRHLFADGLSIKTIGQTIVTPDDITLEDLPRPPEDFPMGACCFTAITG